MTREHHADVAALLEHVDAEPAQARDAVSHVQLRRLLELLLLAIGHHAERHGQHFFRSDARNIGERRERAVHAQTGMVSNFQMKIGRLGFNGAAQKIVDAQGHGFTCLREEKRSIERSTGGTGGQARRNEVTPPSNGRFKRKEMRVTSRRGNTNLGKTQPDKYAWLTRLFF